MVTYDNRRRGKIRETPDQKETLPWLVWSPPSAPRIQRCCFPPARTGNRCSITSTVRLRFTTSTARRAHSTSCCTIVRPTQTNALPRMRSANDFSKQRMPWTVCTRIFWRPSSMPLLLLATTSAKSSRIPAVPPLASTLAKLSATPQHLQYPPMTGTPATSAAGWKMARTDSIPATPHSAPT